MVNFYDKFIKLNPNANKRKYLNYLWFSYYLPWRKGLYSAKYRSDVTIMRNYWNNYLDIKKQGYPDVLLWMNLDPDKHYLNQSGPQYLGVDYVEMLERQQAKNIQDKFNTKKWGLEIGVRYFPVKDTLKALPFSDYSVLKDLVFNYNKLVSENKFNVNTQFTLPQLIELILAGGPENILKGYRWIRRHQFFDYREDMYVLSAQKSDIESERYIFEWPILEEDLRIFWESNERKQLEALVYRLSEYDKNIQNRLKRAFKWQALMYYRQVQQINKLNKFNRFCFFFRFLIDYRLQRFKRKYKKEVKIEKYINDSRNK
jgi:hypothetical protein